MNNRVLNVVYRILHLRRLEISWFVFSRAEPSFSLFFWNRFWINRKLHLLLFIIPFPLPSPFSSSSFSLRKIVCFFHILAHSSESWPNNTNGILWDLIRFSPEDDTFPWFNPSVRMMQKGDYRTEYGNNQVRPNSPSSGQYPHRVYYMFIILRVLALWIENCSFYTFLELKMTETHRWNELRE